VSAFLEVIIKSLGTLQDVVRHNKVLLESNYSHVGKIIHCHLIIENLVVNTLLSGDKNIKLPQSFSKKLKMLPREKKFYRVLIQGLEKLNQLRNSIAHNLNYQITSEDMIIIDKHLIFLDIKDVSRLSFEERIEKFTQLCILFFSIHSSEVRQNWDDFAYDYRDVYNDLMEVSEHLKVKDD
jgi:hypothetical protein